MKCKKCGYNNGANFKFFVCEKCDHVNDEGISTEHVDGVENLLKRMGQN